MFLVVFVVVVVVVVVVVAVVAVAVAVVVVVVVAAAAAGCCLLLVVVVVVVVAVAAVSVAVAVAVVVAAAACCLLLVVVVVVVVVVVLVACCARINDFATKLFVKLLNCTYIDVFGIAASTKHCFSQCFFCMLQQKKLVFTVSSSCSAKLTCQPMFTKHGFSTSLNMESPSKLPTLRLFQALFGSNLNKTSLSAMFLHVAA